MLLTMNRADLNLAHRYHLGKEIGSVPGVGWIFPPGWDLQGAGTGAPAQYGLKEEDFVLVYAAEFSQRKSQAVLIRAMAELPERVHLILPGEAHCWRNAGRWRRSWGRGGSCFQDTAPTWRLVCRRRGWRLRPPDRRAPPFHVMEAMYLGLPVIATARSRDMWI